jgi:hypothetical protein
MAVMNPDNPRFELDGINYSYVVFNRHFYPGTEAACLVPTSVLQDLMQDGFTKLDEYRGFNPDQKDLSEVPLDYNALLSACNDRNMNLLNLTYGSVIGGGLCNAYLPGSEPHYGWENTDGGGSMWQDTWGHTHKSWLIRSWGWGPYAGGSDIDTDLKFARDAHQNVYEVSRSLQGELDAFRFALSFYKMGTTLTQDGDERGGDQDQDQEEEEEQFMDEEEEENPEFDETTVHEYRYRMLEEVYRWALGAREQGWSTEQTPVLHFAYVLDPNVLPPADQRAIYIDLADLKLVTPEGEFYFPEDGTGAGEEEREIWRKYVVPYFQGGTGWEPRLLMRNGAYSLSE